LEAKETAATANQIKSLDEMILFLQTAGTHSIIGRNRFGFSTAIIVVMDVV